MVLILYVQICIGPNSALNIIKAYELFHFQSNRCELSALSKKN